MKTNAAIGGEARITDRKYFLCIKYPDRENRNGSITNITIDSSTG